MSGSSRIPVPAVDAACPYLLAADGAWRSSGPSREHRCTAVVPPAALAPDKQRRLCLMPEHERCATFLAATGQDGLDPIVARHRSRRAPTVARPIARTTPLVLDRGRMALGIASVRVESRFGQVGLVGLMALAFVALIVARSPVGGGPPGGELAGGVVATRSPTVASPAPTEPSGAEEPVRTLVPTEVEPTDPPPAEETSTPAPTDPPPSAKPTSYKVKRGDTLSGIAAEFGTTVKKLASLNGIEDPSKLRVGQVLELP
jgi:LysM repeat protein